MSHTMSLQMTISPAAQLWERLSSAHVFSATAFQISSLLSWVVHSAHVGVNFVLGQVMVRQGKIRGGSELFVLPLVNFYLCRLMYTFQQLVSHRKPLLQSETSFTSRLSSLPSSILLC